MQAFLILLISALLLYGIIKRMLPQGLLFLAGAALFAGTVLLGWGDGKIPVANSTGSVFFDFFELLKEIFSDRFAHLGLTIMMVGGFAKYLAHIQASNKLVEYAVIPLSRIKEPYLLLSFFYILSVFLNMFITSATGLGLLLMVTVYPILIGMGLSRLSAVGMIVTTGSLELGPVQANLIVAAELSKLDPVDYFIHYQLPVAIPTMLVIAVAHYFWQKRCDVKMNHNVELARENPDYLEGEECTDSCDLKKIPWYYALLPLIPFVVIMLFSKIAHSVGIDFGIKLDLITALIFSVAVVMLIDFVNQRGRLGITLENFNAFLKGMETMVPVVTLVVAGSFFAQGLLASGGVDMLVNLAENSGMGAIGMTIVMVLIIMVAAALMGSGNASFIPLANIAPPVAKRFGVDAVMMLLPMQLVSSLARVLSPIVAVSIACAGMAGLNTIDVVKRTSVPTLLGIVTMVATTLIMFS
jgi:DcuC family C4-dicarboxylate transporter